MLRKCDGEGAGGAESQSSPRVEKNTFCKETVVARGSSDPERLRNGDFIETNQNIRTATSSDLDCAAVEGMPGGRGGLEERIRRADRIWQSFLAAGLNGKLVSFVDGMVTDTPDLADECMKMQRCMTKTVRGR